MSMQVQERRQTELPGFPSGATLQGWFWGAWTAVALVAVAWLGAGILQSGMGPAPRPSETSRGPQRAPTSRVLARPIEQVQVGDRVLADNPTGKQDLSFGQQVDPLTWKRIDLLATKRAGGLAEVTLLRPASWFQAHAAQTGGRVAIAVPECGLDGNAEVVAIGPCPRIRPGSGQVVTGIFRHSSASITDLHVENLEEPIGTTPNHCFWSLDRQRFVPAETLRPGERLQGLHGNPRVLRTVQRKEPEPVYNLEIQVAHVYQITRSGLIVHNSTLNHISIPELLGIDPAVIVTIDIPSTGAIPVRNAPGIVYFLYDKTTGELLKVGSTGSPNSAARLGEYQRWARAELTAWESQGWTQRQLELRYIEVESRGAASALETDYRLRIDRGDAGRARMPWDFARERGANRPPKPREFSSSPRNAARNAPSLRDMPPPCRPG